MILDQKLRNTAIRNGVLLGVLLLAISIGSFYFLLSVTKWPVLFVMAPTAFSFVFTIVLVVLFCFDFRKRMGGYWNFRRATAGIFIMFITAYAVQYIGHDLIFAKFIEPDLSNKTYQATIAATNEMKKDPHVDKKRIDDNIADIKKNISSQKNITVLQVVSGLSINLILIFVVALIFGALFKRLPPDYATAE